MNTHRLLKNTDDTRKSLVPHLTKRLLATGLLLVASAAVTFAACTPPAQGLVGWWRAEGDAANVVSANPGTLYGQAAFGPGVAGQCFIFDGSGDGVRSGTPTAFQFQDFTIEAWVRRSSLTLVTSLAGSDAALVSYGGGGYGLGMDGTGRPWLSRIDVDAVYAPTVITDLSWHHLAVTKSGSTVVFYLDGIAYPATTPYGSGFTFTSDLGIGARGDNLAASFMGSIDEPAIYSRPLNAAEVQAIYTAGASGKCFTGVAPQLVVEPTDRVVVAGDFASFQVVANGTYPLVYQWTFEGTNLAGATGTQLAIPAVSATHAGNYAVIVTNAFGAVTSRTAILSLVPAGPCAPPPDGLAGWWRGEGNTWSAMGGDQGTLQGHATYGAGRVGQGFVLDGSGDGVLLGNSAAYQLQDFTLEAWVKRGSVAAVSGSGIYGHFIGWGGNGYGFGLDASGRLFLSRIDASSVFSPAVVTDVLWHHVAVTKSGSSVVFYTDGVASTPQTYSVTFGFATALAVGARGDNLGSSFLGAIDEASIYDRPLAATEILAIYNSGSSGKCFIPTAPQITSEPADLSKVEGDPATLTVMANGSPILRYQWTLEGTNLPGATSTSLAFPAVTLEQAGHYAAVVSNDAGAVTSRVATLAVAAMAPCSSPAAGLVGWWRAEGDATAAAGTNSGALRGPATFGAGKVGQCLVLNGSGAAVTLGNPAVFHLQDFTLETWVKRSSTTLATTTPGLNGNLIGYGIGGYCLAVTPGGQPLLSRVGISEVRGPAGVADTAWHHVAVTKSGTNVVFYVDGVASAMAYTDVFTFSTGLALGARGDTFGNSFLGALDEPSIYARALTAAEVQAIWGSRANGKCFTGISPQIALQPTNQSVAVGETATFTVAATGTTPLAYQWTFEGTNLAGATGTQLIISMVSSSHAGTYAVAVTNAYGATNSAPALLAVVLPGPCTAPPPGLVAWWRAAGNTLDFISGVPGTLTGQATYGGGKVGTAFAFDGNGDGVRVGRPASLQTQDFTIETWIKRSSTSVVQTANPNSDAIFFGGGSGCYGLGMSSSGQPFLTCVDVNGAYAPTNITDLLWHHLAVTKSGISLTLFVDGIAYPIASPYTTVFSFNSDFAVGARGDSLGSSFYGAVDEVSVYGHALATNDVQAIYQAGNGGKCPVAPLPYVAVTPASQSVLQGGSANFTASVLGTGPFSYQWAWNGTNVAGATASALSLSNVQLAQAGNYTVTVTNTGGSVTSAPAVLIVTLPPAAVRVAATTGMAGVPVTVPVEIVANGNENGLQFSLYFDTALLTYSGMDLGANFVDGTLFVNTSQAASGKLGIALALPTDTALGAGTQAVVLVSFTTPIRSTSVGTTITFGDSPTARQLVNAQAQTLSANYVQGMVTLTPSILEGDVNPRPDGDSAVMVSDWVLLGRYAARLEYPTNASEFQRADCAPRTTLGDGAIKVTDWVQAGRYTGAADPLTIVGGPDTEAPPSPDPTGRAPKDGGRIIQVSNASWFLGQTGTVTVVLQAQGNESALGFSLAFDPSLFTYVGAVKGTSSSSATLNVNTSQTAAGKVGIALALSSGSFSAGGREMIKLTLRSRAESSAGPAQVSFADSPVPREVSDPAALPLAASYVSGTISVQPRPTLKIVSSGANVTLTWPAAASNFTVKASSVLPGGAWANAPGTPTVINGENTLVLPAPEQTVFYRLVAP